MQCVLSSVKDKLYANNILWPIILAARDRCTSAQHHSIVILMLTLRPFDAQQPANIVNVHTSFAHLAIVVVDQIALSFSDATTPKMALYTVEQASKRKKPNRRYRSIVLPRV